MKLTTTTGKIINSGELNWHIIAKRNKKNLNFVAFLESKQENVKVQWL